jgi:hypothetical protein
MKAAAEAMSGPTDPADATAAPGIREGSGEASPPGEFATSEPARVSAGGPADPFAEHESFAQAGPSSANPQIVEAQPPGADLGGASSDQPPVSPPTADLDENLNETAESNRAVRNVGPTGPRTSEPRAPIADPEPAVVPGGEDASDRARDRGYGLGALLAATALSGILGAGLMLLAAPLVRGPTERVGARLEQVEQQLRGLAPADLGAIERRLAAVEPEQRSLAERVTRLQAQIESASARPEPSGQSGKRCLRERPSRASPPRRPAGAQARSCHWQRRSRRPLNRSARGLRRWREICALSHHLAPAAWAQKSRSRSSA